MSVPWTITFGGHTFTDDDLTVDDSIKIAELAGGGWSSLDPWGGPKQLASIIAVVCARLSGVEWQVVYSRLTGLLAGELLDALDERKAETAG